MRCMVCCTATSEIGVPASSPSSSRLLFSEIANFGPIHWFVRGLSALDRASGLFRDSLFCRTELVCSVYQQVRLSMHKILPMTGLKHLCHHLVHHHKLGWHFHGHIYMKSNVTDNAHSWVFANRIAVSFASIARMLLVYWEPFDPRDISFHASRVMILKQLVLPLLPRFEG